GAMPASDFRPEGSLLFHSGNVRIARWVPLPGGEPARAARQAGPSVTGVVQSIQKGQPAAASLSRAGGGASDTELTPQALAEMSEERFAEVLNELQARGDKEKIKQLFGH